MNIRVLIPLFACVALLLAACGGSEPLDAMALTQSSTNTANLAWADTFPGPRASYTIAQGDGGFSIKENTSGAVYMAHYGQTLNFSDASVNLRAGELAASIPAADLRRLILLYTAHLDSVPDADSLVYWLERIKAGMTTVDVSDNFLSADVPHAAASGNHEAMTNAEFVRHISRNVFGNAPPPEAQPNWIAMLDDKSLTRGQVVRIALNIGESYKGISQYSYVADLLDNKFAVGFYLAVQQGITFRESGESVKKAMQISAAVTPSGISEAIAMAGATQPGFALYVPPARTANDPITVDTLRACPAAMYDKSPDFYRCLIGFATGTTDSGGEPCKLTVHEDGRIAVTTPAGTRTVSPPYGGVNYDKLDATEEGFFTMGASITGSAITEMLFSMAFTSPALAKVIGTATGIRMNMGTAGCTLSV